MRSLAQSSWLLLILAACNGGQTGDEGPGPNADAGPTIDASAGGEDFFASVRRGFGMQRYDPAESVAELADRSDRIAVGTIAALREDRASSTVELDLAVSEMLKGEPAETLHIMLHVGSLDFMLPDPLPENRLLVFLRARTDDDADAGADSDAGAPEAQDTLYVLTTPQGFVVEDEAGNLVTTARPGTICCEIFEPGSFAALIETLR